MYLEILVKNLNSLCYLFDSEKKSRQWFPAKWTEDKIQLSYRENWKRINLILSYSEAVDMIRQETNRLQLPVNYSQVFDA